MRWHQMCAYLYWLRLAVARPDQEPKKPSAYKSYSFMDKHSITPLFWVMVSVGPNFAERLLGALSESEARLMNVRETWACFRWGLE